MRKDITSAVDSRALKVLIDTYWTSAGWRDSNSRHTPPDDFAYAKLAGLMFDPIGLSHDDIVEEAISAVQELKRQAVADAFLSSLSSRRLEIRSALGSFAVLQHFPRHSHTEARDACPVCGEYNRISEEKDLNVLNFERFKWGGVRHHQPLYASLDLKLFNEHTRVVPTASDVATFKSALKAIETAPAGTSSAAIQKQLGGIFKSNKAEREVFIGILGSCGILATRVHPGFMRQFVTWSDRELPARRFVDMAYPVCWWQPQDGINEEAVAYWFGHVL